MHATHAQFVEHGFALPAAANGITNSARRKNGQLWKNADARIATATHNAGVRFCFARKYAKQRALTAAIEANDPEAITGGQGDGHIVK
jgi:hypothetical protein